MTLAGTILYVERKIDQAAETIEKTADRIDALLAEHGLPPLGVNFVHHAQATTVQVHSDGEVDDVPPGHPDAEHVWRVIVPASLIPEEIAPAPATKK